MTQSKNSPAIPPDLWQQLLEVATEFQSLKPWRWMSNSHVLGLLEGSEGTIRLATMLGQAGEVFGALVYRHETGLRFLLKALQGDFDPYNLNTGLSQDALMLEFVGKSRLLKEEVALYKELGFTPPPRRRHAYPMFRSLAPGFAPWTLTPTEATELLSALRRLLVFAKLFQNHPDLYEERADTELPFFPHPPNPGDGPTLQPADLKWHHLLPPPRPKPRLAHADAGGWEEILAMPQRKATWELDVSFSPIACAGDTERPIYPQIALAVEGKTGLVMGFNVTTVEVTSEQSALDCLAAAMGEQSFRPRRIQLMDERLEQILRPILQEAGIQLELVDQLPRLFIARSTVESVVHDQLS